MLNHELKKTATMEGRSVDMKVIATGELQDAYDIYLDVTAYSDEMDNKEQNRLNKTMFVRMLYWKTTHKKLVIGTVTVLDAGGLNRTIVEALERISTPVEIKDYWKKSFEKYVVVEFAKFLHTGDGLESLDYAWRNDDPKQLRELSMIKHALVCTLPIISWETAKRNSFACGENGEGLDSKCYDGPHGFVRSDSADDFDIPPVTSFPVTTLVV